MLHCIVCEAPSRETTTRGSRLSHRVGRRATLGEWEELLGRCPQANESNKKAQGASYNRVEASDQMEATTSDTIRLAGEKAGRPMHGVWSVFGKPYAPMGLPTTVQHKLPALNRDDINGAF
jgi:hypothetical protein